MAKFCSILSGFVIFLIWPGHGTTLTIPNSQPITGFSIKSSLTVDVNIYCTRAETWKSPFFHDIGFYVQSCTEAFETLQEDLTSYSLYREYEFVDRSATPLTTRPIIRLPKIYHSGRSLLSDSPVVFSPHAHVQLGRFPCIISPALLPLQ